MLENWHGGGKGGGSPNAERLLICGVNTSNHSQIQATSLMSLNMGVEKRCITSAVESHNQRAPGLSTRAEMRHQG